MDGWTGGRILELMEETERWWEGLRNGWTNQLKNLYNDDTDDDDGNNDEDDNLGDSSSVIDNDDDC